MAAFSDNFNRSNTNPGNLGANWDVPAYATLHINNQHVEGYGPTLFTAIQTDHANQVVAGFFKYLDSVPITRRAGVILRGTSDSGYICGIEIYETTYYFVIWRRYLGVLTEVARTVDGFLSPPGYDIAIRAVVDDNVVKIVNTSTGATLVQYLDPSPLGGPNYCGFDIGVDGIPAGLGITFDNFYAEDLRGPSPPIRPTITVSNISTDGMCIRTSEFYDPNFDSHEATQYQVALETGDFSSPLIDITIQTGDTPDDVELTYKCFTGLDANTCYKVRVRFEDSDGMWSEWSPIVHFCTLPTIVPTRELLNRTEKHRVSCSEAPDRFYHFKLLIQDELQQVYVTEIETPEGIFAFGDILPYCVIDYINELMITVLAQWGLVVEDHCADGRLDIPFEASTPRPITVGHNCGSIPIVQVVALNPDIGYPYPNPYNPYSQNPYYPGPYSLADEVYNNFPGEPSTTGEGVWVQHLDANTFRVNTTVERGVIIARW